MRFLISTAISGKSDATTWSNWVFYREIFCVAKADSTWVNHTVGSEGRNNGEISG